jgi:glycosyltransferase involved in cell wall biosynthesis
MEQPYKGFDVLIDALQLVLEQGRRAHLTIVGDGRHRSELEGHTAARSLQDHVTFRGTVSSGLGIRQELDKCDLFVLASRTEGLPRAMIEAMARGLPCIGSAVGGIPELLPAEDLVPPGDARALSSKILSVLSDAERLRRMSALNLVRAGDYRDSVSSAKRQEFLERLHEMTREWQERCESLKGSGRNTSFSESA